MVEITETAKQLHKPSFWNVSWFPIIFIAGSSILRNGYGVYPPVAWIVWGAITTCICYLIEPKPKIGFVKYFLLTESSVVLGIVSLWLVPHQLRALMPEFWAYALPALLFFNAIYLLSASGGVRTLAFRRRL